MNFLRTTLLLLLLSLSCNVATSTRTKLKVKHRKVYPWTPFFGNSTNNTAVGRSKHYGSPYRPRSPSMDLSRSGFNRNCDGQCFFFPEDCSRDTLSCSMITSIVQLSPNCAVVPDSSEEGEGEGDRALCDKDKNTRYFMVSLLRTIENHFCTKVFDKTKLRRCMDREFVAVSFFDDGKENVHPGDIWYFCNSGETSVTSWTNFDGTGNRNPEQLKNTLPYPSKGAGVIWSDIKFLEDDGDILICQFLISTSQLHLEFNDKVTDNNSTASNSENSNVDVENTDSPGLRVKMAKGLAKRNDKNGAFLYPTILEQSEEDQEHEYYASKDAIELSRIESKIIEEKDEIVVDDTIGQRLDNLHSVCKNNKNINCFMSSRDNNDCLTKKSCSILVIIQKIDDSTLKFYLVAKPTIIFGHVQPVQPDDWASIGFTSGPQQDVSDGAITFNCMSKGRDTINSVIGFKLGKNNVNIDGPHQSQMTDKIFLIDTEANRFMCAWTLPTSITIRVNETKRNTKRDFMGHSHIQRTKQSLEEVEHEFDLKHTHEVLMASGKQFFPDWTITSHNYREILKATFSAKRLPINSDLDLLSTKSSSSRLTKILFLDILAYILHIIRYSF